MGLEVAEAFVKIRPDTKAFGAELKSGVSSDVASLAKTFAGLAIGAAVLKSWRDGINELKKAAAVSAQTANAIRATGGAANVTAVQVGELASRLSEMSGADDELIQSGSNLILTFKNVRNEGEGLNAIFDRATTAALDLSTAGFGSMESASIMLGKALNDPVAGLTALQRAGVTFSAAQKATITSLVETGQTLEAQKLILAEIEAQVGGSAKAFGETLPGQLAKAQVAMDNAKGAMLAGLAPALELVASGTASLFSWVEKLPGPLRMIATLAIAAGAGFVALARPINDVSALITRWRAAATASATATVAAAGATDVMTASLTAEAAAAKAAATSTTAAKMSMLGFVGVLATAGVAMYAAGKGLQFLFDRGTDLEDVIGNLAEDFGSLADDQLKSLVNESGELSDAFGIVAAKMLEADPTTAIGRFEQLRAKLVALGIDTTELDGVIADAAASQRDLNDAAAIGAGVIGDLEAEMAPAVRAGDALGQALSFAADAQERINTAIGNAFGAVTTATESLLNHSAATRDMEEAIREAIAAEDDQETAVDEVAVAHDDALQKIIDYGKQTNDTYSANGASAQQARDTQVAALQTVANSLAPGSPLRAGLQAYIDQLNAVPADISTTVSAYTAAANAALVHTLNLMATLNAGGYYPSVSTGNSGGSAIAAASGYQGWVTGPQAFVVGENREPEYVSITPKSKMGASYPNAWGHIGGSGSGTSGGATTTINVTVIGGVNPEDTGRRIGNSAAETLARRGLAVAARTG